MIGSVRRRLLKLEAAAGVNVEEIFLYNAPGCENPEDAECVVIGVNRRGREPVRVDRLSGETFDNFRARVRDVARAEGVAFVIYGGDPHL